MSVLERYSCQWQQKSTDKSRYCCSTYTQSGLAKYEDYKQIARVFPCLGKARAGKCCEKSETNYRSMRNPMLWMPRKMFVFR